MIGAVYKAIDKYGLLENVDHITVAFSGGADSTALLLVLNSLKDEFGFKLSAAHLNHCLRGQEADADEKFCQNLCESLNIEFFSKRVDVLKLAKENGKSTELMAREVRYEFLNSVSKGVIATAHTANDNAETVLFNMARGTGLDGVCGIPPMRDNIIRPLILATREQTEQYCKDNNIEFRIDSTNLEDICSRNKIRHNVLPTLKEINPLAVEHISSLSVIASDDVRFLNNSAESLFLKANTEKGLDVKLLLESDKALTSRVIKKYFEKTEKKADLLQINRIYSLLNSQKGKISLDNGFYAEVKDGFLNIKKQINAEKTDFCYLINSDGVAEDKTQVFCKKSYEEIKIQQNINSLLLNNIKKP